MTPLTGHLGIRKTQTKGHETLLLSKTRDVVAFCHSSNQKIPVAPQTSSPVARLFFPKICPLPKTKK